MIEQVLTELTQTLGEIIAQMRELYRSSEIVQYLVGYLKATLCRHCARYSTCVSECAAFWVIVWEVLRTGCEGEKHE